MLLLQYQAGGYSERANALLYLIHAIYDAQIPSIQCDICAKLMMRGYDNTACPHLIFVCASKQVSRPVIGQEQAMYASFAGTFLSPDLKTLGTVQ